MNTRIDDNPRQEKSAEENFEPASSKEIKVTFLLDEEILNKIKTLSRKNDVPAKDQINQFLAAKINEYEEANGSIEVLHDDDYV